jgi:hypothetical protein
MNVVAEELAPYAFYLASCLYSTERRQSKKDKSAQQKKKGRRKSIPLTHETALSCGFDSSQLDFTRSSSRYDSRETKLLQELKFRQLERAAGFVFLRPL